MKNKTRELKEMLDGFILGEIIYLGIDYSTGEPREDKAEYYKEIKDESISNTKFRPIYPGRKA